MAGSLSRVTSESTARAYLDAVVARDYPGIRSLLDDEFRLRDLSPPGFTEVGGADEALGNLREFLDIFDSVNLVESDIYDIGAVTYVRARLHFVHEEAGERILEQHHLLTIVEGRIQAIDELCTGLLKT